ncbi:MAG TPA: recombinase family protein, partial [Bacteroidia bacterium]|nr:recombinase family protein [Bacteroidia bacterium]
MKPELEIFTAFAKKSKFAERIEGSNCIIYTRVSSKEQEQGYSLETQKREIEIACEKNGFTILAYFGGVFESAKTDEREEFTRMLKFARRTREKVSHIVVYSVDRFSRSGANAIYIASELRKENIKIFAVTQPGDTFTSAGKMQQNLQFIFSEYDNDLRREKCTAGVKEMLLNGYWPMRAPMGYNQITRKKRDNLNLEQRQKITVNATGLLIRKAFYWKAKDKLSNAEILERLKKLGLNLNKNTLCDILRNPFYCGIMTHNFLNGQVVEGRHEKLISKEIFLAANSIRSRNVTFKPDSDFSEVPLKNFLKCGLCGSSFVGYEVKKKKLWYYKCNKKGCKCNRSAKTLNQLFYEKLCAFTIDEKYIEPIKDEFLK